MGRPVNICNSTVPTRNKCVALLLLLCSFVCPLYATTNNGNGPEEEQRKGQVVHDADLASNELSLIRGLAPAVVSPSSRSVAGRLLLESLVFTAVLATSLTLFPGLVFGAGGAVGVVISLRVGHYGGTVRARGLHGQGRRHFADHRLSGLLLSLIACFLILCDVYSVFIDMSTSPGNRFLLVWCSENLAARPWYVQLLCEVTRMARARFPVVATLLKSAARGDHRGGPIVQAILAGLGSADCGTFFDCPRHRIQPLLAKQPQR
ncbi:hypothetical protein MRX96_012475 [Rhipicephalus microplus]